MCTASIVVSQRTVNVRQTVIAMSQTRYHTVATLLLDQILQINFLPENFAYCANGVMNIQMTLAGKKKGSPLPHLRGG